MDRRYKMDGYGIWCDICPWRHTLKPSKWVNRQRHPFPPTSLHAVFLPPNKVKNISNDGNYFINKVMLKCWTKLLLYSTSLLVIRNEPQNYISLTENISKICIIPLSGATRWRFSRLTWGVLQKCLHYEIIIQDMWTSCIPLFSAEINA